MLIYLLVISTRVGITSWQGRTSLPRHLFWGVGEPLFCLASSILHTWSSPDNSTFCFAGTAKNSIGEGQAVKFFHMPMQHLLQFISSDASSQSIWWLQRLELAMQVPSRQRNSVAPQLVSRTNEQQSEPSVLPDKDP